MRTNDDTFFDIHMHAFNLSHPYFCAFIKRYQHNIYNLLILGGIASVATKLPIIGSFIQNFVDSKLRTVRNLLSVFENDIGSFFLVTENCLREDKNPWEPLLKADVLMIGEKTYKKIVITPLMMDFGQKGKKVDPDIHYSEPAAKPVNEQVVDVFNAIRWYKEATYSRYSERLTKAYRYFGEDTRRLIEIYPFMGINTQNYEIDEIKKMLDKYFSGYRGLREDLFKNIGQFDGDVRDIKSNFFAGIKVYPPLGFDPCPSDGDAFEKVDCLYDYCCNRGIPITSHGGGGGFVAIEDKKKLADYTSMSKWETVLKYYPSLKLNIAHFPAKPDSRQENQRLKSMIKLILEKDNVYTDFSCRAVGDEYYMYLKGVLKSLSDEKRKKLTSRILFGSDYAVCLGGIDSYNQYVYTFSTTKYLCDKEKHAFCCVNPQQFLFTSD